MSSFSGRLSYRWLGRLSLLTLTAIAISYGAIRIGLPDRASSSIASTATHAFPDPILDASTAESKGEAIAVFAGGCFWGMEAVFEHLNGVTDVVSGYSGGTAATANYDQVSRGETDHAEGVKVTYDPSQISYGQLLKVYFSVAHDPTQLNRQGPDVGTQYRSAIFFDNKQQQQIAQAYIQQLNQSGIFDRAIATQIVPLDHFYPAEDYHQDFVAHNPNHLYVVIHDLPQLKELQETFPTLYRAEVSRTVKE